MHLGIKSEHTHLEGRVAATPQSVASFIELGATVTIESGAGSLAGITDTQFRDAGRTCSD